MTEQLAVRVVSTFKHLRFWWPAVAICSIKWHACLPKRLGFSTFAGDWAASFTRTRFG